MYHLSIYHITYILYDIYHYYVSYFILCHLHGDHLHIYILLFVYIYVYAMKGVSYISHIIIYIIIYIYMYSPYELIFTCISYMYIIYHISGQIATTSLRSHWNYGQ